jgi:hypothetical protein
VTTDSIIARPAVVRIVTPGKISCLDPCPAGTKYGSSGVGPGGIMVVRSD